MQNSGVGGKLATNNYREGDVTVQLCGLLMCGRCWSRCNNITADGDDVGTLSDEVPAHSDDHS